MASIGRALMESWLIALASLVGGALLGVISKALWIGRNAVTKADLDKATEATATEIHNLQAEIAAHGREVGETITALRTHVGNVDREVTKKITEVELYVRDTFVRRDSWHTAMNQLQESIGKSDAAAEQRMLRLEEKLDRLFERITEAPPARGRS